MKKTIIFILTLVISNANASGNYNDSPTKMHSIPELTKKNLIVRSVDNPMKECDLQSKRFGNGGFAYQVQACAFWDANMCTIIVGKSSSTHTLGHELLHCIKGDWHPQ